MTPRTRVVCLDINDDKNAILEAIHETKHTYFPVYDGEVDNLVGLLSAKMVLSDVLSSKSMDFDVRKCVIPDPLFVPGSIRADVVLEKFRSSKKHMAIVVDEFGGMAGVISIIDLMESIVGDVPDDNTSGPENAVKRADGSWLIEGNLAIDDAAEVTGIDVLNNYKDSDAYTIAGLIMEQTGHIPKEGERLELPGVVLEVVDMDGNRIDKVLIQERTEA
jgi:putative hemolysin